MELTKLYVYELDGRRHYFATECDRNYATNRLPIHLRLKIKCYTIRLELAV